MTPRFRLINPNTTAATTEMMLGIAREALAGRATIDGMTAARGAAVILDEAALEEAADEVGRMVGDLGTAALSGPLSGVVIAAFGDPGLADARAAMAVPVVGIAEAAICEAAAEGRFVIVTTTPGLDRSLRRRVEASGAGGRFAGLRYTRSGAAGMADPGRLHDELLDACAAAVREDGAAAIIIGGGPLAAAARALRPHVTATLIEPIPAAMRALLARVVPQSKEP